MMAEQQDEAHIITIWLKLRLTKAKLGLSEAYLFGSISHSDYETNDVDVVFERIKHRPPIALSSPIVRPGPISLNSVGIRESSGLSSQSEYVISQLPVLAS